tara:strand:+ start:1895 stop:2110 length:216 start_codon:yes stop_codon:yes gene_type:complete
MLFIHDNNNPGFFFEDCQDRFDHMQSEGCNPERVTPEKAQAIWEQLEMTGTFEIYLGMSMGSRVYSEDFNG